MKLHELAAPRATQQISQVFESYFGSKISFDQLNRSQAGHMLNRVRGILGEHRSTSARHTSEQNPDYLKLVMMEQALTARLGEMATPAPATGTTPAAKPGAPVDPKLKMAQDKIKKGLRVAADKELMYLTKINDNMELMSKQGRAKVAELLQPLIEKVGATSDQDVLQVGIGFEIGLCFSYHCFSLSRQQRGGGSGERGSVSMM